MATQVRKQYQYFSKWRLEWCDFSKHPSFRELRQMKKYHYELRAKPN